MQVGTSERWLTENLEICETLTRRVNVACLQKTKWKHYKVKMVGAGLQKSTFQGVLSSEKILELFWMKLFRDMWQKLPEGWTNWWVLKSTGIHIGTAKTGYEKVHRGHGTGTRTPREKTVLKIIVWYWTWWVQTQLIPVDKSKTDLFLIRSHKITNNRDCDLLRTLWDSTKFFLWTSEHRHQKHLSLAQWKGQYEGNKIIMHRLPDYPQGWMRITLLKIAYEVLGQIKAVPKRIRREAWLWNPQVKEPIEKKSVTFKKWQVIGLNSGTYGSKKGGQKKYCNS